MHNSELTQATRFADTAARAERRDIDDPANRPYVAALVGFADAVDLEQLSHIETALNTARAHMDGGQMFFAGIDFARARRMVASIGSKAVKAKANELCDEVYSRGIQHEFCRATGLTPSVEPGNLVGLVETFERASAEE
jgi:hypothetical protein